MNAKPGDRVKVTTPDRIREGLLMPSPDSNSVVIKLDNGYNIGIDNKNVKELKIIEKYTPKKDVKKDVKEDNKKPTISILHTGGTIASKVDYKTGGVVAKFTDHDFISMVPEIKDIANVKTHLVCNMMSEDMLLNIHYKKLSDAIQKEIKNKVDGIIIGHGTDTLAMTSAALSFMLENLPIPVILVGSQRSSDRGSSDAAMNIICAAEFIAKTDFTGVAICMHETINDNDCLILPACKTKKLHTSRRDAFKPVNGRAIARVNYETRKIEFLKKDYSKKSDKKLVVKDKFEEKVAIVKVYPNMFNDIIDILTEKKYKGIILEGTGIGHAPTNIDDNLPNYKSLKKFIDSGGIVVMTSQCIFGRVHKDIYVNTRRLGNIGVIFGEDMLTETAYMKLSWLLGNYKKEEVEKLITKNLRGEINDRLMEDEFLG